MIHYLNKMNIKSLVQDAQILSKRRNTSRSEEVSSSYFDRQFKANVTTTKHFYSFINATKLTLTHGLNNCLLHSYWLLCYWIITSLGNNEFSFIVTYQESTPFDASFSSSTLKWFSAVQKLKHFSAIQDGGCQQIGNFLTCLLNKTVKKCLLKATLLHILWKSVKKGTKVSTVFKMTVAAVLVFVKIAYRNYVSNNRPTSPMHLSRQIWW